MDKKVGIIAVVAVVIIVAAAAIILLNNNGKESDPTATILVEDQDGVFFWTEGSGKTIADCLEKTSAGVKVTLTDSSFGKYIDAVNGLAGTADFTGYWSVYLYNNGAWTASELGVSSLQTKENKVVGLFYVICDPLTYAVVQGGPEKVTVPAVSDAKIWDGSKKGTIFCIEAGSGMYTYFNNDTGETMTDRFTAATTAYNVPFTVNKYGGVGTLYGIGTTSKVVDDKTIYIYWSQYGLKDGKWTYMETGLKDTPANDYEQFCLWYSEGSMSEHGVPSAPIYS